MIKFENWIITADGLLARQFDHLSRRVEVVGDLPEGWEWELLVQVGDAMDIIRLTPMPGGADHTLTEQQVSIPGYYTVQLRGRRGEAVQHTNTVQCFVPQSLTGDAKWPELPSEFSQAEQRISELNAHPPKPGWNGFWMIWNPEIGAYEESREAVGQEGPAGYTPVKGVDYWTQEERQSMVEDVLAALPSAEGVGF